MLLNHAPITIPFFSVIMYVYVKIKKTFFSRNCIMAPKKKSKIQSEFHFQTKGNDFTVEDFVKISRDDLLKRDFRESDIKFLEFYIKPEEAKVYFVANKDTLGSFDL